ncbi:MAG TPA: hypothetical protein VHK69_21060 [Chitinophagaceae bacterium]|jgi:hypothetical protein|nr:hypothetical protein [Chitinophagaceae bacterium]
MKEGVFFSNSRALQEKQLQPVLELEFISLGYCAPEHWLYAGWKGRLTREAKQAGCDAVLNGVYRTGCTKILNDNSAITEIWDPPLDWVRTVWFPQLRTAGVQYFAWVYAANTLHHFSIAAFTRDIHFSPAIKVFSRLEEGLAWLESL